MSNERVATGARSATDSGSQFVQYLFLTVDPQWRRLDQSTREQGRAEFAQAICGAQGDVTTYGYSTLGLKVGADILLWWKASSPDAAQELTSRLLQTGLGRFCAI